MKRTAFILAATAAIAFTGCEMGGSSTETRPMPVEITETHDNGDEYVTKLEYDEMGLLLKETKTKNGGAFYVISDFNNGYNSAGYMTVTRTRVTTNDDGTTATEKLVSTLGAPDGYNLLETKYEVFEEGNDITPIEVRETQYHENGNTKEYTVLSRGVETLHRTDYDYNQTYAAIGYTYKESKDGGAPVPMFFKATRVSDRIPLEHELYSNWDGTNGTLIEEQTDYEEVNMTAKWTISRRNADGSMSKIDYEKRYENMTFPY
jgi:hypothetical protein